MNQALPTTDHPQVPGQLANSADPQSLVRSLAELRSGRRLEKIIASIESFLFSQVSRLNQSLDQCESAVDQNQVLQRIMADFERQKSAWEMDRQAEIKRLSEASEKLIASWKQLEDERQALMDHRNLESVGSNP